MHYFTWKLELVSKILWVIVDSSQETREIASDFLLEKESNFNPPCNRWKCIDNPTGYINQQNVKSLSKYKTNSNNKHRQALTELKNKKCIVIKESDKGGAVPIMDSVN